MRRSATVAAHFQAIKEAFASKPVTVDCGCNESYYAYVYPNQPYKIHVCKAFWSAPPLGTDSKGGTLVHEMSHFTVVAGTDESLLISSLTLHPATGPKSCHFMSSSAPKASSSAPAR